MQENFVREIHKLIVDEKNEVNVCIYNGTGGGILCEMDPHACLIKLLS